MVSLKLSMFYSGAHNKHFRNLYREDETKIDSIKGRLIYNRRLGTAEPPLCPYPLDTTTG